MLLRLASSPEAPNFISVLGTAGGQMSFSSPVPRNGRYDHLWLLNSDKKENLVRNSGIIVFADTLVALMAGLAVIPAAVANGIASGVPVGEISLGGPKLLFVTLQDVFANTRRRPPFMLSSTCWSSSPLSPPLSSLMEVIGTFFLDRAAAKGKQGSRTKITIWVSVVIMLEALIVAVDGLGSNGLWTRPGAVRWFRLEPIKARLYGLLVQRAAAMPSAPCSCPL